jgi:hypothetical protein
MLPHPAIWRSLCLGLMLSVPLSLTWITAYGASPAEVSATETSTAPAKWLEVERWGVFEVVLDGPQTGNPFVDVQLSARFRQAERNIELRVPGFYDGAGAYRIRFSPPELGNWDYETESNAPALRGKSGAFQAIAPGSGNHGPVKVANTFHFQYADGTPYRPFGTTCYAWAHQPEPLLTQTLTTLRNSPFNKLRMCVFPKSYQYNTADPLEFPFEGQPHNWDTTRFRPAFFHRLERSIEKLQALGIEADVILFHPYDQGRWGFDKLSAEADARYVKYLIARLAAYRNVWWSLANEYDFIESKVEADWDRLAAIVQQSDPFDRLRSIHNGTLIYNHNQPWVTHASIQNGSAVADFGRAIIYRDVYRKPIVLDEVKYEGNLSQRWGNLSAEEMVHRCWIGAVEGTYVGHGEYYLNSQPGIWLAEGGQLRGASPPRIDFLRRIVEAGPDSGLEPLDKWQESQMCGSHPENYFLIYLGRTQLKEWTIAIPTRERADDALFPPMKAEIIDCWNMTITAVPGELTLEKTSLYHWTCPAQPTLTLPDTPLVAVRLTAAE